MEAAVIDRSEGPQGTATATFDVTRAYRFHLDRIWDEAGPIVTFVMLNPSTADADVLDPTVRRCVGFARTWGFGTLRVVNLFAFRATDPADLVVAAEPIGDGNDEAIVEAAGSADRIVVAWVARGVHRDRATAVSGLLARLGVACFALGVTQDGHPRHPLYVAGDTLVQPWPTTALTADPPDRRRLRKHM